MTTVYKIFNDESRADVHYVRLTDDQIKLLGWLSNAGLLYDAVDWEADCEPTIETP